MIIKAEPLRRQNINNHNNRKKTLQRIRKAIKLARDVRRALRGRPQRERHRPQDTDAAQARQPDLGRLQQVAEEIAGWGGPGGHEVGIAEQADEEDGAAGFDEGDGGEVADVEVVDALLEVFVGGDFDGAVGGDGDADGDDAGHEGPEDGAECEEGAVFKGVHEDLVAVEGEAGFLDL